MTKKFALTYLREMSLADFLKLIELSLYRLGARLKTKVEIFAATS